MSSTTYQSHSCFIPIRPNPNGAPPNADHPTTMRPIFIGVLTPLLIIATIAVSVRVAEVLRRDRRLKVDDYASLLALLFLIPTIVIEIILASIYRGDFDTPNCFPTARQLRHCPAETRTSIACLNTPYAMKLNSVVSIFSIAVQLFGRLSLCALYLSLFGIVRWLRYTIWSVILLTVSINLTALVLLGVYYFPHGSEHWNIALTQRQLIIAPFMTLYFCVRILCDLMLVLVPIQPILRAKMPTPKKISTLAVFSAAIVITIATSISFYYQISFEINIRSKVLHKSLVDIGWKVGCMTLLMMIEQCLLVIVSSAAGCVSAWRNVFREKSAFAVLKSQFVRPTKRIDRHKRQNPSEFSDIGELIYKVDFDSAIELGYLNNMEKAKVREVRI